MPKASSRVSAALLLCRRQASHWEFLLAHPGGPFFARKDEGAWSLPKGLIEAEEEPLAAARREFREETGFDSPEAGPYAALGEVVQKGGKRVHAWAFIGDVDVTRFVSNSFELEWPPRSGKLRSFPEVDQVGFFTLEIAQQKLLSAQLPFLERALVWLASQA